MEVCNWIVREGYHNTFWAFTPCKRGFNYLSKVSKVTEIKETYNGRVCPICGNTIICNMELVEDLLQEVMNR